MSDLKTKLEAIAAGETSNHPLVSRYLGDEDARDLARVLERLTERQGRPARHPPSRYLPPPD